MASGVTVGDMVTGSMAAAGIGEPDDTLVEFEGSACAVASAIFGISIDFTSSVLLASVVGRALLTT